MRGDYLACIFCTAYGCEKRKYDRASNRLLDFQKMGLMFDYNLLAYEMMTLFTFFAGLTIEPRGKSDKWLKALLCVHGIYFVSWLNIPMPGIFRADASDRIGIAVPEFWCIYFCPVVILSVLHCSKKESAHRD